jgi:hypothetical protein
LGIRILPRNNLWVILHFPFDYKLTPSGLLRHEQKPQIISYLNA